MNQIPPRPGRVIVKTTCARDCYDACGIAVVKDEGVVRRVLGDPDHAIAKGALCGKCAIAHNGAWRSADTTRYADYVLPAASFLEFDDLVLSYFDLTLSAQVKAMEPMGESLPNQEIFRRLAIAMGQTEPELVEPESDLLARLIAQTTFEGNFQGLAAVDTVRAFPVHRIPYADGKFETESGKVEIASARAEAAGYPRCPEPHADTAAKTGSSGC